ncbi:hypothetical protein JTE90_021440 [Oedothorax gibbosus]|uniref:Uncharacterized protein n=1 Tax=Oedothorax gibbosus TaxID=931172 RepID=A0AAV6VXZ2_9ARAC|nr:hypothetical protein JTE90_021440 [Oedothorax gibbosus]
MLLASVLWKVVNFTEYLFTSLANSVAILVCYLYLKNYRRHTLIIVDGYIIIIKTFAEFFGAAGCICYGLLEVDLYHTTLGLISIFTGLILKALLLHQQNIPHDLLVNVTIYIISVFYVLVVLCSGLALHGIIVETGLLSCATKLATCVIPLVALTDRFIVDGGQLGTLLANATDAFIIAILWCSCGQVSLKYYVVVPSILGLLFTFIRHLMQEIQKSARSVSDLYA